VSGAIVSGFVLAFAVWLAAVTLTGRRVAVNSGGLTYWTRLRKQTVPWPVVRSFRVGISRSLVHWPCLVITTDSDEVRVDSVAGTRRSIENLVRELEDIAATR
jgi:hypothetical protein